MLYTNATALYAAATTDPGTKSAGELIIMLIALVAILIGTYFATKYVAKLMQRGTLPIPGGKRRGAVRMTSRQGHEKCLDLIDTVMLDRERAVTAVRAGDKLYILGFTQSSCTLIDTLEYTEPQPTQGEPVSAQKPDFLSMFKQYSGWGGNKSGDAISKPDEGSGEK